MRCSNRKLYNNFDAPKVGSHILYIMQKVLKFLLFHIHKKFEQIIWERINFLFEKSSFFFDKALKNHLLSYIKHKIKIY